MAIQVVLVRVDHVNSLSTDVQVVTLTPDPQAASQVTYLKVGVQKPASISEAEKILSVPVIGGYKILNLSPQLGVHMLP